MFHADFSFDETCSFEWDDNKNALNIQKHGLDFEDTTEVFYSSFVAYRSDRKSEARWIVVGRMNDRIIAIVVTQRGNAIRIISARSARKNEERAYHQKTVGRPP